MTDDDLVPPDERDGETSDGGAGDAGTGDDGESVLVPGGRDVRGTLDRASDDGRTAATGDDDRATACVVACPPHPQHRGHRGDTRLCAVSDELTARGVDCLRIDYGDWDEGYGERADVRNAVGWARERYDAVGLFGFSFGGTLSLLVASEGDIDAVAALAPTARIDETLDAVAALDDLAVPVRAVYGTRDDVADWEPVVERVEAVGGDAVEFGADHFFVGQAEKVADAVAPWLAAALVGAGR